MHFPINLMKLYYPDHHNQTNTIIKKKKKKHKGTKKLLINILHGYRPKIFNKLLKNKIQQYIRGITHHYQVVLIPQIQDS